MSTKQHNILILSTKAGGGHTSAANAVQSYLNEYEDEFSIEIFCPLDQFLPVNFFDNFFANERWTLLKYLVKLQYWAEKSMQLLHKETIKKSIFEKKPDMIISVFPVCNKLFLQFVQQLAIPMIIVSVDTYPTIFIKGISQQKDKSKFQLFVRLMDSRMRKELKSHQISSFVVADPPVSKEFNQIAMQYKTRDPQLMTAVSQLKQLYQITMQDKVIAISLGAKSFGNEFTLQVLDTMAESVKELHSSGNIHVLVLTGKNTNLFEILMRKKQQLEAKQSSLIIHPEQWLNAKEVALRMAMQDVGLIKPGGATTAEYMAMGKRALFKSDSKRALEWEKLTMDYFVTHKWGTCLKPFHGMIDKQDLITKLKKQLTFSKTPSSMDHVNQFGIKLLGSIRHMLTSNQPVQ